MRTFFFASLMVLVAGPAVAASPPAEFPGLNEKWSHYQSPHFELYSAIGDVSSRGLLEQVEILRAILLERMKLTESLPLPVTFYCFKSHSDFMANLPAGQGDDLTLSFWSTQSDRNVMMVAPNDGDTLRSVAGDQFVEYLFAISGLDPARWYCTGLCQLYGNAEVSRKSVELGKAIPGWETELHQHAMFPLDEFFGFDGTSHILESKTKLTIYCAQAWLFMHYCEFGRHTRSKEKLQAFLAAVSDRSKQRDPSALRRTCQEILGCDYPELQEDLHKYLLRGEFPSIDVPRPALDARATYVKRDAPEAEMRLRLAELAFRLDHSPRGRLALLQATDHEPVEARIFETLGNVSFMEGDAKEARNRWAQAIEAGSTNPAVIRQYADLEAGRWFQSFDPYFQFPPERATQLRELLLRSLTAAPEQNGAYEWLAWVESACATTDAANVARVEKRLPQLQHRAWTMLALAIARFRAGDYAGVRSRLNDIEQLGLDSRVHQAALILLRETEHREALLAPEAAAPGSG